MTTGHNRGTLYIVATPIGNLSDISRRMEQVLSGVDLIACEDTRHTRKLLSHLEISVPLTSYYREKEQQKAEVLLKKLLVGRNIALVSDAGTPGLSDPGAVLVRAARSADIPVIPVPGPSALAVAMSVAGLDDTSFFFGGFPSAKKGERCKLFTSLKALTCPLIFYESPHRIRRTLQDCLKIFGDRQAQLFRELTKLHEQHLSGSISKLIELTDKKVRGELVLIIDGRPDQDTDRPSNLDDLILWYRDTEKSSLKDAARIIATDLDISRSQVYQRALSLWHEE
ncbi:MAG: 16S rRNA (cytidine(1402)-2'-O)-methyltransferase [Deltaproteobacteria bacterium]|nr:16S rRNA (cytidine(1402)-2'-O)-methyltransferase [Deltaproteobacteria bacterium]